MSSSTNRWLRHPTGSRSQIVSFSLREVVRSSDAVTFWGVTPFVPDLDSNQKPGNVFECVYVYMSSRSLHI